MASNPAMRTLLLVLIAGALVLPIVFMILVGSGAILGKMGDTSGGGVAYRIALAAGLLWLVDLVCLVLLLAVRALLHGEPPD